MKYGIEKELLLFDKDLKPKILESKYHSSNVTLDYADNQIEIVTDVFDNIFDACNQVEKILENKYFDDNYIWPYSLSPNFEFEITTKMLSDQSKVEYRDYLCGKYDKHKLLMTGIHLNISKPKCDYFKLMKCFYSYLPIIIQFYSFTPHSNNGLLDSEKHGINDALSLRNSQKYGYNNEHEFEIDYSNLLSYQNSISKLIENKKLKSSNELYSFIRLKPSIYEPKYIELRFIDNNPLFVSGINKKYLVIIDEFIKNYENFEIGSFDNIYSNIEQVVMNGNRRDEVALNINGVFDSLRNHTINFLNKLNLKNLSLMYENDLDDFKVLNKIANLNVYFEDNMFHKSNYLKDACNMELSTRLLIQEAIKQDREIEIISKSKNVVMIDNHYFIQATKTNFDKYANIVIMNDKVLTKNILMKNNIKVANGIEINKRFKEQEFVNFYNKYNCDIVIKPTDANFGNGISILKGEFSLKQLLNAVQKAFEFSDDVILEKYFEGEEFRFLVINNKLVSVVKRDAANVIGDGVSSIRKLVEIKNLNRGENYKKPLEKIRIDDFEKGVLLSQSLTEDSILKLNQKVYLRYNSNISTGGDSIEVMDEINEKFKKVALKCAQLLDVIICGVDILIKDNDYCVIEMNYNPAIHMHTLPYLGKSRNVAKEILNLIDISK